MQPKVAVELDSYQLAIKTIAVDAMKTAQDNSLTVDMTLNLERNDWKREAYVCHSPMRAIITTERNVNATHAGKWYVSITLPDVGISLPNWRLDSVSNRLKTNLVTVNFQSGQTNPEQVFRFANRFISQYAQMYF